MNRISGFATALNQIRTPRCRRVRAYRSPTSAQPSWGQVLDCRRRQHIELEDSGGSTLRVQHLATTLPDGRLVGQATSFEIAPGERVLCGPSGSGETTLLRAIATLWPYGSRRINSPAAAASALGAATVSAAGHAARCAVLSAGGERSP